MTGGRIAEREGTAAFGPKRPRRGETHCLSPQGELCVSSAGPDRLRSSAQLSGRTAPPRPRGLQPVRPWAHFRCTLPRFLGLERQRTWRCGVRLDEIYKIAVQAGRDADPRGAERLEKELAAAKKEYDELKEKDREFFDLERLTNPYADTRILNGAPETDVRAVLVGIDMEVGETRARGPAAREAPARPRAHAPPRGARAGEARRRDGDAGRHPQRLRGADRDRRGDPLRAHRRGLAPAAAGEPHARRGRRAAARAAVHVRAHARRQQRGGAPAGDLRREEARHRRRRDRDPAGDPGVPALRVPRRARRRPSPAPRRTAPDACSST